MKPHLSTGSVMAGSEIMPTGDGKIETDCETEENDAASEIELKDDDISSGDEQITDDEVDMEITKDDAPQFHTIEYFSGMLKTDAISDIATQKSK
uniref:Uncharacterized protein n=1 Tax=Amphimedon queenslandica TaxID=400682 RepID=A0A1X7UUH2_AMPQE